MLATKAGTETKERDKRPVNLVDNHIRIGHITAFRIYNISCFGVQDFDALKALALKVQTVNEYYDPAAANDLIVLVEDGQSPSFIDRVPDETLGHLTPEDVALMDEVKCGAYVEGENENGQPYFVYLHMRLDLMESFLQSQGKDLVDLHDYFVHPVAHGPGEPDETVKADMAKQCFIQGAFQIFGFRKPLVQW